MRFARLRATVFVVPIAAFVAGACSERAVSPLTGPSTLSQGLIHLDREATAASVSASVSLQSGDSIMLVTKLAALAAREMRAVLWTSTDLGVVSVNAQGYAKGKNAGSAKVIAAVLSHRDTFPILVAGAAASPVASVVVSAPATSLKMGDSTQLSVTLTDAQGRVVTGRAISFQSSNAATVTISAVGLAKGLAVGTATMTVTSEGKSGSLALTITAGTPPPPPPAPPSGGPIALPALPQTFLSTPYVAATGKTLLVRAGDNLQTALNSAQRGDEVVLQAGAVFKGSFTLPAKPGTAANGWIVVRTEALSSLPPQGSRVTPAHASAMPKLITPNYQAALQTAAGASGWRIVGLDLTVEAAFTGQQYGIVLLGDGGPKQTTLASVPTDLVLDRVYVHGAPSTNGSRCIALNSARTSIIDSYIHECHGKTFDSQAIAGWNGPGPFKIVNNTLAGAGENVMFGGSDPQIPQLIPSDIEFRRNYVVTPLAWKNIWLKKNLLETKNAQRVLIEGNVFDGAWAHGQVGYAFLLKSANQSGGCTWCASRDITIRYNIIRNAGAGFNLAGREGSSPHPVGEMLNRVLIEENIIENINVAGYNGEGRMVQVLSTVSNLSVRKNTMMTSGMQNSFLTLSRNAVVGFNFSDNLVTKGQYGLFGDQWGEGTVALKNASGSVTMKNVVAIGAAKTVYTTSAVLFVPNLATALLNLLAGANAVGVLSATQGVVIP